MSVLQKLDRLFAAEEGSKEAMAILRDEDVREWLARANEYLHPNGPFVLLHFTLPEDKDPNGEYPIGFAV